MSSQMNEENKRWSAKRKSALVLEIIQGKTTVAEASRQFDLTPSELESWVEQAKAGMENALRAKPQDVRQQYEKQISQLQAAYGEVMLELRARKKLAEWLERDDSGLKNPYYKRFILILSSSLICENRKLVFELWELI